MPAFTTTISITQIVSAALLVVAVFGILLTYTQIRNNYRMQKATFFKDLYSTMFSDDDIRQAMYAVQYGTFVYDEQFPGSPEEKRIDRMLSFADLACDLYAQGVLTHREMAFFTYEFFRIYKNPNVQAYLDHLQTRYAETGQKIEPFPAFVAYCETELRHRGQAGIRLAGKLRFNLDEIARLGRMWR